MKTSVGRLLTGVVALALLLGGFGLMQSSAQAQAAATLTADSYLCSVATAEDVAASTCDAQTTVVLDGSTGDIIVTNLDVAEVSGSNPRTIASDDEITMVQQFTDANDDGAPDNPGEIRAYTGNRIQLMHRPTSGFAITKIINIDNVDPLLVTNSPEIPLVVKGGVNITFSADITDGGSGYTGKVGAGNDNDIEDLNGTAGTVPADGGTTDPGGVRLIVAGNVVGLGASNFEAIDGGWRVSAELGSSAIQNIGANVPWYFETRDRAGNTRRTSGSIAVSGAVGQNTVTDTDFIGLLPASSFEGTMMAITRGSRTVNAEIDTFGMTGGVFTLTLPTGDAFFADDDDTADVNESTTLLDSDKFALKGSNLLTIDSKAPRLGSPAAVTGIVYSTSEKGPVRGLSAKANSIQVNFADDGKFGTERAQGDGGPDGAGSGLDAASVTPAAFTVSGNTVNSAVLQGNSVYLTLADNLAPDEQPTITIASGMIMDKAGNAFGGERIGKAADGLGPNLGLVEDGDLSKEKVTLSISTDEQLASLPDVVLSRVINSDGDVVNEGAVECVYAAVDADDPNADDPALPAVTQATEEAGTCEDPQAAGGLDARYGTDDPDPSAVAGRPAGSPNPSQTAALSYTYAVTADTANPLGEIGGKYNIYVEGVDTQHADNKGKVGHASDANHSAAFTFQLDTKLNGDVDPVVRVSEATGASGDADVPNVEAINPMIVTVDWAGEAGEYPGDSYRTVTLTSAELKISFSDGSSESRTFDLTTEVSTQDSRKYTIPLLNPKVGEYSLTVKGEDSAGNASGTAGHSASWNVVAAKPVPITLEPGWNLISLPFQPANPAINSVIPSDHPISLVMTFDGAEGVWLFSRRDAETGLFQGDVAVITASNAYFVNTEKFGKLDLLRPPVATAAAAPAQPPAIPVKYGWNLVPVASSLANSKGIDADSYFGTLADTWLRALAWDPLGRKWDAVSRGTSEMTIAAGESGTDRCGETRENTGETSMDVPTQVCIGEGLWLWVTEDGTLIPE